MDQRIAIPGTGFQHQHAAVHLRAQAVGQHAAGRTGADDDVVVLRAHVLATCLKFTCTFFSRVKDSISPALVAADARLPHAAIGRAQEMLAHLVDPDEAGVDLARQPVRPRQVRRPDGRRQAHVQAADLVQHRRLVVPGHQRQHRPEQFLARQRRIGGHIGIHGGFQIMAARRPRVGMAPPCSSRPPLASSMTRLTRSRCSALIIAPIVVAGSVGSPGT